MFLIRHLNFSKIKFLAFLLTGLNTHLLRKQDFFSVKNKKGEKTSHKSKINIKALITDFTPHKIKGN